jgi:predicted dehydrogenase
MGAGDLTQAPARLRLALVGLGNQGQEHLMAAANCSGVEFVVGVDPSPRGRELIAARYPELQLRLLDDLRQLQPGEVDALVLALPHHCYASIWDQVLALRLPILKEKPLGRSYDEAFSLLHRARQAGCPVQTAIQRRHHPSYEQLKRSLTASGAQIEEIHAHLHLGFTDTTGGDESWRADRQAAGGGALLDAGYHLVDLIHYLIGPFDLVSASLWCGHEPVSERDIDDRAWLTGRSETCWIMLDSWRSGHPHPESGRPQKAEGIVLKTTQGLWQANREGLWHDGQCLQQMSRDWLKAMTEQLERFARNVRQQQWHDAAIWDQLPAMRLIDEAYRLAARY